MQFAITRGGSRMAGHEILGPPLLPASLPQEFPARSREYYEQAIADGRLRFEKGPATPDTVITTGQQIRHFIHRHEPPCTGDEVAVLGLTEDLVAVGKPAGMPVHASGQYRKNTVLGVLQASRSELGALHPAHRLDKPVSGVLLFARSPAAADALRLKIEVPREVVLGGGGGAGERWGGLEPGVHGMD